MKNNGKTRENFTLRNYLTEIGRDEVTRTILKGLTARQKYISSVFFYDAEGSRLFEEITRLPEYYPTRAEKSLLRQVAPMVAERPNPLHIIEIGSGDCSKVSILLSALPPRRYGAVRYSPIDASSEALRQSAQRLQGLYPGIAIDGIVADFTRQLHCVPPGRNRFFCFLGSTIGNLSRAQNRRFFQELGLIMKQGDALLLGVDMIKPVSVLEQAYNDSRGVTAAFNRNILKVVNRLLGTDFDPQAFTHLAFYNHHQNRIEMHLKARETMRINCPSHADQIRLDKDETIHTENSHKYTRSDIEEFAATAGLEIRESFTDENRWFSLVHFLKK